MSIDPFRTEQHLGAWALAGAVALLGGLLQIGLVQPHLIWAGFGVLGGSASVQRYMDRGAKGLRDTGPIPEGMVRLTVPGRPSVLLPLNADEARAIGHLIHLASGET